MDNGYGTRAWRTHCQDCQTCRLLLSPVVACEFVDAENRRHTLIDKVPMFSTDALDDNSTYPRRGGVRCTVLGRWTDDQGRELLRISAAEPDAVESTEELREFVVSKHQVKRKWTQR